MKKTLKNLQDAIITCIEKDLICYLSGGTDDEDDMIYRDCEFIYKNELIGHIEYSAYKEVTCPSSYGDYYTPSSGCDYDLTLESMKVTELSNNHSIERTNIKDYLNKTENLTLNI